jgi:hypothetical protein
MPVTTGVDLDDLRRLVQVDVERQTIDADRWIASLSDWYRAAATGIVRHWQGILDVTRGDGRPQSWVEHLCEAAGRLTAPAVGVRHARGAIEWRHPSAPLESPICGVCWVGDASGGIGGTYLCWTSLTNLGCPGGAHWTRDLRCVTPLGGAAESIVAYVAHRCAVEGP